MREDVLLQVDDLRVSFPGRRGLVRAVDGVSFRLRPGEALGVVGESGSGKSVTALSLLRLIHAAGGVRIAGTARFDGRDLLALRERELRQVRGREIGMIFQDPLSSLNPVLPIGEQIAESLRLHRRMGPRLARARAIELLQMVGIPAAASRLSAYPQEFSGGMRQRVMIAIALACEPKLLIADEPTTALDVTVQVQILELLNRLREELGMAMILITHDLAVVAATCDRVQVMYAGRIVEDGPVDRVLTAPAHPYTQGLLRCVPRLEAADRRPHPIPGQPAQASDLIRGCRFSPRCVHATGRCHTEYPPFFAALEGGQRWACWLQLDAAGGGP